MSITEVLTVVALAGVAIATGVAIGVFATPARETGEATCLGCGCTDSVACPEGCDWLWVNRATGEGLCSHCGESTEWEPLPADELDALQEGAAA